MDKSIGASGSLVLAAYIDTMKQVAGVINGDRQTDR